MLIKGRSGVEINVQLVKAGQPSISSPPAKMAFGSILRLALGSQTISPADFSWYCHSVGTGGERPRRSADFHVVPATASSKPKKAIRQAQARVTPAHPHAQRAKEYRRTSSFCFLPTVACGGKKQFVHQHCKLSQKRNIRSRNRRPVNFSPC